MTKNIVIRKMRKKLRLLFCWLGSFVFISLVMQLLQLSRPITILEKRRNLWRNFLKNMDCKILQANKYVKSLNCTKISSN